MGWNLFIHATLTWSCIWQSHSFRVFFCLFVCFCCCCFVLFFYIYFLRPQCPVLKCSDVVCSRQLGWWMWFFSGLYQSCFLGQSALNFSINSILASLYMLGWGCGSLLRTFASLSTASFVQMPSHAGIHCSSTLLGCDRVLIFSCSCLVGTSVGPDRRAWSADWEFVSMAMFCRCLSSSDSSE